MALDFQEFHIPFAAGLSTKDDPRALEAPALAVAQNVQFDETGGLQLRKPYASIGTSILGGGTISNIRKVFAYGDELLCFTSTALYSWSPSHSAWVSKGGYLAPKLEETPRFVRTSEQTHCDRAELSNVIVYAWKDQPSASTSGVYVGAVDKTTGAVLLAPTAIGSSTTRPRLLALTSVIHLYYVDSSTLKAISISPTSLASSVAAAATSIGTNCNERYDACVVSNSVAIAYRRTVTTSYEVKLVTAALAVTAATKARTCDGSIAIAYEPNTSRLQIVRGNGTAVQGDLLNSGTLADVFTAQAISTALDPPAQITAAFRSVADSGNYRCYVFYSDFESSTTSHVAYNYADTANNLGTAATFRGYLGIGSRAFDYNGSIYVWLTFAIESTAGSTGFRSAEQNSYFLFRDDGHLVAKAVYARGGGYHSNGYLPGVQSLGSGSFAWCGIERRVISVGTSKSSRGYGARAPRDVKFAFDADEARRCVRLGETLYITGAQILQYDGEGLAEVGFHVYPYKFTAANDGAGTMGAGTYTYKGTDRWDNAKGERERSTTATTSELDQTASQRAAMNISSNPVTLKIGSRSKIAKEIWRTPANPTIDAPFYLVTSPDPAASGTENLYVANLDTGYSGASLIDDFNDTVLITKEINPENGGVLENLSPPAALIIAASDERLFLAGVAGEPHRVWYSKLRGEGEIAAFHDSLAIEVPPKGGPITALAIMDETLIVFRESAIYAFPGEGFDNAGGGLNYGPARAISSDCGAESAEAVALIPPGLIFKSSKGWYLLQRGGATQYIGDRVASFDSDTVQAIQVVETQHQVRCLTSGRMLVFDYAVGQWSEWTVTDGVDSCVWDSTHVYASSSAVKSQATTYSGVDYALDVETAWIKLAGLQGYQCVRWLRVLGEYRSAFDLRVRVARDYLESDASGATWFDDEYKSPSSTTVGGPFVIEHGPSQNKGQSIKIRLTGYADGSTSSAPTGEAFKLTGLSLEVGQMKGLSRRAGASERA